MTEMATGVEEEMNAAMVGSAMCMQVGKPQPASRRRFNGWFPEIEKYREAVGTVNRIEGACLVESTQW
jgi:hypothetical protein